MPAAPPRRHAASPARRLLAAALLGVACALIAVVGACRVPWLGLDLRADTSATPDEAPAARVRVAGARGPSAEVPVGSELVALRGDDGAPWPLVGTDLIEEPDFFDTYPEMRVFYTRQSALRRLLDAPVVHLVVRAPGAEERTVDVRPAARPVSSLPLVFWFQLLIGTAGFLLSTWVLVLRPGDPGARLFAVLGASYPGFTIPAAVYGARELALDGGVFRLLDTLNHLGANAFGIGLVGLFLAFPKPLVRPRLFWLVPAVVLPWWALDAAHLAPDQNVGSRLPIMLEMLVAIVLGVVQIRATRGDARARASLRWVGLSVLVGSGLYVFLMVGASLLGWFPPLPQGYSFGFFFLMHVGVAVGLRRHKLFELEEWAWVVLFWVLGALALIALDATLVAALEWSGGLSTAVSLLVCGFVWLPLRALLWRRVVGRGTVAQHELFDGVLRVSFAESPAARREEWTGLLRRLFTPLEVRTLDDAASPARVAVEAEGLALVVPRVGSLDALRLEVPFEGRGLFAPRHQLLAQTLVTLLGDAESRREAFERGVLQERARIARDLHDDVGAHLLGGLYRDDLDGARQNVRLALGEMRAIVQELTGKSVPLDEVLAEARHEALQRLEGAGLEASWPLGEPPPPTELDYRTYRHLASMLREVTSNVIRHASARAVRVDVTASADQLLVVVEDDGVGLAPGRVEGGNGLGNLRRRAEELGGAIRLAPGADAGTRVEIQLPLGAARATVNADTSPSPTP